MLAIFVNGVNCANYNGRPVSVNTINATANNVLFVDNHNGERDTQMDGLTVPLECVSGGQPGRAQPREDRDRRYRRRGV